MQYLDFGELCKLESQQVNHWVKYAQYGIPSTLSFFPRAAFWPFYAAKTITENKGASLIRSV